ncbi:helix-turn-helix domain-containing protein [Chryseobacterium sp. L7]|uniref:Helix-turn-helix domain-containing protein n=1 Tax=Chryseobacterium endalhagicum TaxID=2797638 RepID=A0ABS1Q9U7_9FLAO|nr:helix-turn-helix domain-containing protein [Chryseobacterium endalhagicum]MBL1219374.1 helix-turn-helix domain-containing protein [Chryseobacterium endalhagicum]
METINFYGVTPADLIREIANEVKSTLFADILKTLTENEPKRYLSADEVCQRFAVTKPTIHEWRKRKILKSYKLGSRVYYRLDEIENAMIIND